METIYIDSLFGLNLIIDYFILLCTAKVCGVVLRRWRYFAAAVLGSVYAALTVLPETGFLVSAPMKIVLAALMSVVAFGGERRLLRCFVVFLAVSAAFGGAVWAASMLAGTSVTGRLYIPVSMRMLILSFALCYAAVSLVFRRAGKRAEREIVNVTLKFGGRTVSLRALRDTGNTLFDPLSGKAVAVTEAVCLLPLFPASAADAIISADSPKTVELLSALPGCEGKFRLIPYSAVGTERGLLPVFRPDSAQVDGREERDLLVALCASPLSEGGDYSAII